MKLIFERIRNLREDKDMTQSEIAQILNISQRTYSRYENGERSIPIEILSGIADYHNTSVDYLIGRTNVKKPYSKPGSH
jgi:transcriptional regulator with XRE-family HTH domain